jgi:hypothetical protein
MLTNIISTLDWTVFLYACDIWSQTLTGVRAGVGVVTKIDGVLEQGAKGSI